MNNFYKNLPINDSTTGLGTLGVTFLINLRFLI